MNIIVKMWTGKQYRVVQRTKDMYAPAPDVEVSSIYVYESLKRIVIFVRKRHD